MILPKYGPFELKKYLIDFSKKFSYNRCKNVSAYFSANFRRYIWN